MFPPRTIKPVFVSVDKDLDYKIHKERKEYQFSDTVTTPLHHACNISEGEAVR